MHPKNSARSWAVAGLLAIGLALVGSPARAQDPKSAPMATADRTGAVTVTIGGQVRFQMKSKRPIKEAFNENERVVQVLADATDPTTLILVGRSAGSSRLEVTDVMGAKESYLIVVQRDLEMLKNLIKKTLPTAAVEITPVGESGTNIILSGYTAREEDREAVKLVSESLGMKVVVNTVTVGGGGNVPHVQLDLTLAKVDRTRARSRGANWIVNGQDLSVGSLLGGLTTLQPGAGAGAAGVVGNWPGIGVVPSAASTVPGGTANLIAGWAPAQAQLLLAALKVEGLAKLVSAPTIVARSGEEADLLVGAEIPVISAAAGINGPGVTYRPTGTELRFLPVVYGNGKIHLTVSPRVTSVSTANALTTTFGTSPSFEEQRMTTSVIVDPGQTIAIGGLIQTTQQATVTKIPHLGDIPYLGYLFSFSTTQEEEIELVILLTPRLVDPADCKQMPKALPGSETRKPDDFEFYLETVLEAPRGPRPIWEGGHYTPSWKVGPSADIYPCAGGNCPGGNCPAAGVAGKPVNGPTIPVSIFPPESRGASLGPVKMISPPSVLPPRAEPPITLRDNGVPSLLIDPPGPEKKTAELPQK
jgi:pilus assembly protein CpaC